MKLQDRIEKFLPKGVPRYVRCYDNGGQTADRYTVVFTGNYRKLTGGSFWYLGASSAPFHPQGFGQHGESDHQIDRPSYGHLGKKVAFSELPADVQKFVLLSYKELWSLTPPLYSVKVYAVGENEDRIFLGSWEGPAESRKDAERQAFDKHWDSRLDSASCSAESETEELD